MRSNRRQRTLDPSDDGAGASLHTPDWLRRGVSSIQESAAVDRLTPPMRAAAGWIAGGSRRREVLEGRSLGHALHPLMTDLPLGMWMSAGLLDIIGGRRSRVAARRLIGAGLAISPVTVASGMVDYTGITSEHTKRVANVHAVGNVAVAGLYLMSWLARRDGRFAVGRAYGFAGATLAMATGYLGGHLSYAHSVGTGERGWDSPDGDESPMDVPATEPML